MPSLAAESGRLCFGFLFGAKKRHVRVRVRGITTPDTHINPSEQQPVFESDLQPVRRNYPVIGAPSSTAVAKFVPLSLSLFGATNSPGPPPPPPGPSSFLPSFPRPPVRAEAPCWCVSGLAACVVQVSVAVTSNQAAIISNVPHNWTPSNLATPILLRF